MYRSRIFISISECANLRRQWMGAKIRDNLIIVIIMIIPIKWYPHTKRSFVESNFCPPTEERAPSTDLVRDESTYHQKRFILLLQGSLDENIHYLLIHFLAGKTLLAPNSPVASSFILNIYFQV